MRAPVYVTSFVQWRWTPSVVLVLGSLAFVGVVVLIVPEDLGSVTSGTDRLSRAASRGRLTKDTGPATDSTPVIGEEEPSAPGEQHTALLPKPRHSIVQSIFHPIQKTELPVEPVDPNPPPPPPEAPLPPPTNTIYTLPTPPPASPNPLAAPAVPTTEPTTPAPAEPQGITGQ